MQSGEFVLAMRALDVGHGERHHHAVRMPRCLLVHGIDQIERVPREVSLIRLRIDPDRKEFRAQISAPRFVEADVSSILRIGRSNVEAFVEKSLRRVGVGVDDDGGIVNGARLRANRFIGRGTLREREGTEEQGSEQELGWHSFSPAVEAAGKVSIV